VAALLALGATVTVARAPEGDAGPEEVPLEALLERRIGGEVRARVRTIRLHVSLEGKCWGEDRVARTPVDEPIVSAIAAVEIGDGVVQQARLALTGVWSEPVRLAEAAARLVGGPLDGNCIREVAEAVTKEVTPQGDFLGSGEYRRAMAGVTARRALERCSHQAMGDRAASAVNRDEVATLFTSG
jgi:CO/xanthine dehydrogenase FAD-binding subunit